MCQYFMSPPFYAMHAVIRRHMLLTQRKIGSLVNWPTRLVSLLQGHLCIGKTLSPTAMNSLVSISMAKVKPTFIRKQNQIPISTSEVHVTVAPIPPCCSMTLGENLTEVRSVHTNRLKVLSQQISDSLWMNTILSSGCCCSQMPVM